MIWAIIFASLALANESEIQQAFQKEYAFLVAQKESLVKQKRQLEESTSRSQAELEAKLRIGERELAAAQSENERLFEEVQTLERKKREEQGRESALLSLWKRADRNVKEAAHALSFRPEKLEIEASAPEKLVLPDIARLGKEAVTLLQRSASTEEFVGTYLTEDNRLREGTIVRLGRVAAVAIGDSGVKMLGPDGEGRLKVLDLEPGSAVLEFLKGASQPSLLVPVYLFQNLQDRASIRRPGGFTESIADAFPVIFLAALFAMVGWLFYQLARI